MNNVYPIPGDSFCVPEEIGAKALSLVRLAEAGLRVPPGLVFGAGFFAPWFDALRSTDLWQELRSAPVDRWPGLCEALKAHARTLSFDTGQQETFDAARARLAAFPGSALFAVRSSSPDEDLASARRTKSPSSPATSWSPTLPILVGRPSSSTPEPSSSKSAASCSTAP